VRCVVEDGLPYRTASWHLWRDHRVFVPCFIPVKSVKVEDARSDIPCDAGRAAERSDAACPASHTFGPSVGHTFLNDPSVCFADALPARSIPGLWTRWPRRSSNLLL
jgi:hypothetical protein